MSIKDKLNHKIENSLKFIKKKRKIIIKLNNNLRMIIILLIN